jgi:hypothetical protein
MALRVTRRNFLNPLGQSRSKLAIAVDNATGCSGGVSRHRFLLQFLPVPPNVVT